MQRLFTTVVDRIRNLNLGEALRVLDGVVEQDPERPRSFHRGHVLLSVITLEPEVGLSRSDLQIILGLGGGSIRSLISRLTMNHLTVASPSGMRLKGLGTKVKEAVVGTVRGPTEVGLDYLRMDASSVAYLVKNLHVSEGESVRLRDAVVRYGGTGATTCSVNGADISVPGVTENLEDTSRVDALALKKLKPSDGDAIFISSAPSKAVAASAGAAALFEFLLERGNS
ncbi:MAG TPA: DUF4443 domain-containing protein [Thermoproteota archaeon]|nr:DUF4443 domain-containing protein [Thermoproteota archaeon]